MNGSQLVQALLSEEKDIWLTPEVTSLAFNFSKTEVEFVSGESELMDIDNEFGGFSSNIISSPD